MTPWAEPRGISSGNLTSHGYADAVHQEDVRFVVVEQKPRHSICLRISTYGGQATTKYGATAADHAAIVAAGTPSWLYEQYTHGENLTRQPIEVKVETSDPAHAISPKARVNFTKPYTVEHNIYIQNIGRVVGQDSLQRLKEYYAEGTGHVVNPTSYGTYTNAYGSGNSLNTPSYYNGAQF